MKAHVASLINAFLLISMSLWGYLASEDPSFTALIPTIIGTVLVILNKGVKNENKIAAHVAVLLTLLILFGLGKPLTGALGREDNMAVVRVVIMMVSTVVAMVFFVRSFIEARKRRAAS
ncbi:MAG TPA: hypothetical protein DCE41_34780 [Cytophagales bacterium]|nr:hypothetical protein [Cytophagales bacterium]HAA20792.1 hypothetical protein [Cytophagales bacterium]HAP63254.1 hypothetical protein [Cytophagales bacterium]